MFSTKLAETRTDYVAAYELLYEAYLLQTYISPAVDRIHYRPSYSRRTSRTIVTAPSESATLAGTMTVVRDSARGIPMESHYSNEVGAIRQRGESFAEVCGLAVQSGARSQSLGAYSELTRFLFQYGKWLELDWLVIVVHPRKLRFYRRRFGFEPFGPVCAYAAVSKHLALPCKVDLHRLRETMSTSVFDQHFGRSIEASQFAIPPMSSVDRAYFALRTPLSTQVPCLAPGAA